MEVLGNLLANANVPKAPVPPIVSVVLVGELLNKLPEVEVIVPFNVNVRPVKFKSPSMRFKTPEIVKLLPSVKPPPDLLRVKSLTVIAPAGKGNVPESPAPFTTKSDVVVEVMKLLPGTIFLLSVRVAPPTAFKLPACNVKSPEIVRLPDVVTPAALFITVFTIVVEGWPPPNCWAEVPL